MTDVRTETVEMPRFVSDVDASTFDYNVIGLLELARTAEMVKVGGPSDTSAWTPELRALDAATRVVAALAETFDSEPCGLVVGDRLPCRHPKWQHVGEECVGCIEANLDRYGEHAPRWLHQNGKLTST